MKYGKGQNERHHGGFKAEVLSLLSLNNTTCILIFFLSSCLLVWVAWINSGMYTGAWYKNLTWKTDLGKVKEEMLIISTCSVNLS